MTSEVTRVGGVDQPDLMMLAARTSENRASTRIHNRRGRLGTVLNCHAPFARGRRLGACRGLFEPRCSTSSTPCACLCAWPRSRGPESKRSKRAPDVPYRSLDSTDSSRASNKVGANQGHSPPPHTGRAVESSRGRVSKKGAAIIRNCHRSTTVSSSRPARSCPAHMCARPANASHGDARLIGGRGSGLRAACVQLRDKFSSVHITTCVVCSNA